jgi:hypothetical protein
MREIKFRAWDKDKNKMTEWDILKDRYGYFNSNSFIVMQYTGLKDKNGKEIYEGDILYIDWKDSRYSPHINKYPVAWNTKNACWDLHEGGSPQNDAKKYMEVVGNIYQNPELLERNNK